MLVEIKNVSKTYESEQLVLDYVSFSVSSDCLDAEKAPSQDEKVVANDSRKDSEFYRWVDKA